MRALYFALGAAVGSVASYFIFKKKFQKEADDQIKEVRAKMSELQKDNDVLRDVRTKASENYNKPFEPIAKATEGNNEVDYASITKKYRSSTVVKDEIKEVDEHEYFDYIKNKEFDERTFTFYQGDGSLVDDESGMMVADPEKYVGADGVDAMSKISVEEVYYVDEPHAVINCVTISEDNYYGSEEESDISISIE